MDKIITSAEKISLSSDDLINIISPTDVNIIEYEELMNYNDIEELFNKSDNIIILYQTKRNYGHWVTLLRYGNTCEYYDSYGEPPDHELFLSKETIRNMGGEMIPHLSALLKDAGDRLKYKVIYNNIQVQKFHNDVNTCGRYAALRVKLNHINLNRFNSLLLGQKYIPDIIVTYLTYLYINQDIENIVK